MPRAPYDTTADALKGPHTGDPLGYKFTLAGRLVPINHEVNPAPAALACTHYFNWNGTALTVGDVAFASGYAAIDIGSSDILECPPGSGNYYTVFRTAEIVPRRSGLLTYRRAWLLPGLV